MNVAGHDSDLAFARADNARTIGTNQTCRLIGQIFLNLDHVQRRDALGNANNDWDSGSGGFHNRIRCEGRRNINHGRIRAGFLHGVGYSVENRNAFMRRAALAGRDSAYNVRSILNHLLCMEGALFARDSLNHKARFFIHENAQLLGSRNRKMDYKMRAEYTNCDKQAQRTLADTYVSSIR